MSTSLQRGDAAWKQRYRVPVVLWTSQAHNALRRGLAASNRTGVYQLYAWDVPSGALRQLTDRPEGFIGGTLAPDVRAIYYLDDQHGNEIGHYVRVPYEGGVPQDITPNLPPYSSFGLSLSNAGNLMMFIRADQDGFHLCRVEVAPDGRLGTPEHLYHTTSFVAGPALSYRGDLAVLISNARSGSLSYSLLALDGATGAPVAELWDGEGSSLELGTFAPIPGDLRMLATNYPQRRPAPADLESTLWRAA